MVTDVHAKWVRKFSFVEFAIDSLVNASSKMPFELAYEQQVRNAIDQLNGLYSMQGVQMIDNISRLVKDAKEKIQQAQAIQAKYCNKHHHPAEFVVNNKVLLTTKNL